jgi:hypothetical protein
MLKMTKNRPNQKKEHGKIIKFPDIKLFHTDGKFLHGIIK